MRLLFPVVFGLIVFSVFGLPHFFDAQDTVARFVHIATSGR